jgi:restriction system protein
MPGDHPLIPPHGGYEKLRSYQAAQLVYDATVVFCDRFVDKRSRTHDQMVQAARSGVRNIAEGSMASATSRKTEIKLTNVARASLEELLLDYKDFLRHNGLPVWDKDSPQARAVRDKYRSGPSCLPRSVGDMSDQSDSSDNSGPSDPYHIAAASAEVAANTLVCLINQASYLLGRQLQSLERQFLEEGGFTERLYRERRKRQADRSD